MKTGILMVVTAALFSVSSISMANETGPATNASRDAKSKAVKTKIVKHKKAPSKHSKYKRVKNSKNMQLETPHEMH